MPASPTHPSHLARPPLIVGLTGGIASGKTTVANLFAELDVEVIDADQVARDIVEPGTTALAQIVAAFGKDVLEEDGRLGRRRLRDRVFADPGQRRLLESITHPAIRQEMARRSAAAQGPYQIHVIPLLVEGGRRKPGLDRILVVDCPTEHQLARLMRRDGSSAEQARQILAAQASRQERLSVADDVILNSGDPPELGPQVKALHERYLRLASEKQLSPAQ